jgi:hypothetical protein
MAEWLIECLICLFRHEWCIFTCIIIIIIISSLQQSIQPIKMASISPTYPVMVTQTGTHAAPSNLATFWEITVVWQTDIVNRIYKQNICLNTARAYDPKVEEFKCYCESKFLFLPPESLYTVTHKKVYPFIFYQCFWDKKPHGHHDAPKFDYQDYLSVHLMDIVMVPNLIIRTSFLSTKNMPWCP